MQVIANKWVNPRGIGIVTWIGPKDEPAFAGLLAKELIEAYVVFKAGFAQTVS